MGLGEDFATENGDFKPAFFEQSKKISSQEHHSIMDNIYHDNEIERPDEVLQLLREADPFMESGVRKAYEENPRETGVFVCGNDHFFGNYGNNLYERLADLSPVRLKLPDMDRF